MFGVAEEGGVRKEKRKRGKGERKGSKGGEGKEGRGKIKDFAVGCKYR